MPFSTPKIPLSAIFRLGSDLSELDAKLPEAFSALAVSSRKSTDIIGDQRLAITEASQNKLVELIVIPDRYFDDEEVMATVQVRNYAHMRHSRIAILMSATDAAAILQDKLLPESLLPSVYKISTIRHGFLSETQDENADLIVDLAKACVSCTTSKLREIVIRACGGAGPLDKGLASPVTLTPIGQLFLSRVIEEEKAELSRSFLHGHIGEAGTPEYQQLKKLSIRTQTLNFKKVALTDPNTPPVLYSMKQSLFNQQATHPQLGKVAVKGYFETVNPVPETNPTRMGLWERHNPENNPNKKAKLSFPKAVRLTSSP